MKKIKYEFAILKQVLNNGKEIYTPVVRPVRKIVPAKWERIICLYGKYLIQDLDFTPNLSYADCESHILGYQEVLKHQVENEIKLTELHTLEQKEI